MPLDIGVGILLALGAAELFGIPATPALIAFGVAAALLPDIDILTIPLFGKWYHRTYTHYPIFYVPLIFFVYIVLGPVYATLFAFAVYAHLIHDTFGIGWGIAWLWPFSPRKFLLFPEKERALVLGTFATWMPEEEGELRKNQHRTDWIRYYYFRPNTLAYIEYGVLFTALVIVFLYFW